MDSLRPTVPSDSTGRPLDRSTGISFDGYWIFHEVRLGLETHEFQAKTYIDLYNKFQTFR